MSMHGVLGWSSGSGTDTLAQLQSISGLGAIVMAAGLGKRMRSKVAKVLHPVGGRPMVLYAVEIAERIAGGGVVVVVGHQGDRVRAILEGRRPPRGAAPRTRVVEQGDLLGTGHAVMQARVAWREEDQEPPQAFVILNGDTPLLTETTVRELWRVHHRQNATLTILTTVLEDPSGYGRVVRSEAGEEPRMRDNRPVLRVVEDRDASEVEARVREVNVGTYLVDAAFLFEALDKLLPRNAQHEYYLTDLVGLAAERGLRVEAVTLQDSQEGLGINSREQLAAAELGIRRQVRERWMAEGVTLRDPMTTWIDADVVIGPDTVLSPDVTLEGTTRIGQDCEIRSHARLSDCVLGDRVTVLDSCVLREATLEDDVVVGPFAHLRPGAVVRRHAKVGNFVEMKQAELGEGSKANHLTYLGDTRVGRKVNIGAGTVTCNYDGMTKYQTVIEDDVFIGSDALLVAPVTVGRGALVAAGSTVTENVPEDALAIGRAAQINRPGWAARRRALMAEGGQAARGEGRAAQEEGQGARGKRQGEKKPRATSPVQLVKPGGAEHTGKKNAGKRGGKQTVRKPVRN